MSAQPQPYKLRLNSKLARLLKRESPQPVILETEGVRYRVVREEDPVNLADDPWADYDAEKMRAAVHASAGVLIGVDRDALLADLRAERGQDSVGRPAE